MTRKKYQTSYNPITGQKEKILKKGYYKDPFSGKIKKSNNTFSSMGYNKSRPLTKNEQKTIGYIMIVSLIGFIVYQIWIWISNNIILSTFIGIAIICGIILLVWKVPTIKNLLSNKIEVFGTIKNDEINDLINVIKGIKVQDVRNEQDFEKQLYQRLDAKGYQIQRQVNIGQGKRVDLIVGDRIGIELKVADKAKNLQDLIGQVTVYKNSLKKFIIKHKSS